MSTEKTILDLGIGEDGLIKKLHDIDCACKLLTLGILPKVRVEMMRKSPFGGTIYLKVGEHLVAMRESEARNIELE